MKLGIKIAIGLGVLYTLVAASEGFIIKEASNQIPQLTDMENTAIQVSDHADDLLSDVLSVQLDVVQVQQYLSDISATRGMDGMDDGLAKAEENAQKFDEDMRSALSHAQALGLNDLRTALKSVQSQFPSFYQTGQEMAKVYVSGGPKAGNQLMTKFDPQADAMEKALNIVVSKAKAAIAANLDGLAKRSKSLKEGGQGILSTAWGTLVFSWVSASLINLAIIFYLNRRFKILNTDVQTVLDQNFDKPLQLSPNRQDEFGPTARALHEFVAKAKEIVAMQSSRKEADQRASERRKADREKMAEDLENQIGRIAKSVASAAQQLDMSARNLTVVTSNSQEKVQSVSHAVEEAASSVETVAAASEELSASSREIASHVDRANKIAEHAAVEAQRTDELVRGLVEAASKIGDVINLIHDIAAQTNLLALNATIEAARAGDAGKGFAVVANEVKSLANQTAKATDEIALQIADVQHKTDGAVEAIKAIADTIDQMSDVSSAIMMAVTQQSDATLEITRNIQRANTGTRDAAESASAVSTDTQEGNRGAHEVLGAADELNSQAEALQSVLDNFLASFRLGGSTTLQWGDNWLTGNAVIDADHKKLVEMVNELSIAFIENHARDVVGKTLKGLVDYTHEHFAREEVIWTDGKLSSLTEHKAVHAKLLKQVDDFAAEFKGGTSEVSDELLAFLRTWLIEHVFQTDKAAVAKIKVKKAH